MAKWCTTAQLHEVLCLEGDGKPYTPKVIYALLKRWRNSEPRLLLPNLHYKLLPYEEIEVGSKSPSTVYLYSLRRVVTLIHAHRFASTTCLKLASTTQFHRLVKSLADEEK